jgi:hypothetical protein
VPVPVPVPGVKVTVMLVRGLLPRLPKKNAVPMVFIWVWVSGIWRWSAMPVASSEASMLVRAEFAML